MESPNLREVKPRQGGPETSVTNLFRLDERTILITGGIGFMGVATAKSVLELGGDVVCLDYYKSLDYEVWGTVESSATKFKGKAWSYSVDVTDIEKVRSVIEQALIKTRYPLRGIIACAGISGESPAVDYPIDLFRRIIDVNLSGAFICVQAAAREICKHKYSASIVLVASMSGHGANKGVDTAAYNSSKSGVHQLARSLAAEWGSRPEYPLIRVNSLSPGYIRTPMTAPALTYPKREEEWSADNMLNRLSFIDEYRGPIVYLLSDASSFMTGADLRVDGGHTAW